MLLDILADKCLLQTSAGVSLYLLSNELEIDPTHPWFAQLSGTGSGLTLLEEFEGLRRDLCRLEAGDGPSVKELRQAPILDSWEPAWFDDEALPRLAGTIHRTAIGLPHVVEGSRFGTLQILAIDQELAWMRDRRGFYVLGSPPNVRDGRIERVTSTWQ